MTENADRFSKAVGALMLLASQLSEFADLPDASEEGLEISQAHFSEMSAVLSNALQTYIDSGRVLLSQFNSLSEIEQRSRTYLWEAVSTLGEISDSILPSGGNHVQELRLSEVVEYAQQLKEAVMAAEHVKLCWIADIIAGS